MKVWVVLLDYDDGCEILGVFTRREDAESKVEAHINARGEDFDAFTRTAHGEGLTFDDGSGDCYYNIVPQDLTVGGDPDN